jgi:cellulose synthase/poly-beta-1,6-N-acetylglucosamine synthase-like glycosyltransferase
MDEISRQDSEKPYAPRCTVVVPTRDRPSELDRCLKAVTSLDYPSFDVLVVDNAPSDGQAREVAARWRVRYVAEPLPGVSRARNRGVRETNAEIIAYLDDDSICEPSWLSSLVEEFKDPLVMAVTARFLPLRVTTEAQRMFVRMGGLDLGEERLALDRQTPLWFERSNFGGIGGTASMAFRRRAFDVWEGFNERLGRGTILDGGEEPYAFFSLIERGYRVVYAPRAVVYHSAPESVEELRAGHLKVFTDAVAYMTLLFFEHPRYRGVLLKFLAAWFRGDPRSWRGYGTGPRPRLVPRWRELLACLPGPIHYVRSLLAHKLSRAKHS